MFRFGSGDDPEGANGVDSVLDGASALARLGKGGIALFGSSERSGADTIPRGFFRTHLRNVLEMGAVPAL